MVTSATTSRRPFLGLGRNSWPVEVARRLADNKKFLYITTNFGRPEEAIAPIKAFGESLREDMSTKEAIRLFAEDELSSAKWLWDTCAALNSDSAKSSASASM